VLRDPDRPELEVAEGSIRVKPEYTQLELGAFRPEPAPKLLYHAARRKAYPAILERGLAPAGGRAWVILFPDREMALRVGRRRDPEPVLLTVQAGKAEKRGAVFYRLQELVYLVQGLEPDLFTGPPLPKEKEAPERKRKEAPPKEPPTPGSVILDPARVYDPGPQPMKGKKGKREDVPDWKRAARKDRSRGK
jgi:putative RNA 2'-phosphotransferase